MRSVPIAATTQATVCTSSHTVRPAQAPNFLLPRRRAATAPPGSIPVPLEKAGRGRPGQVEQASVFIFDRFESCLYFKISRRERSMPYSTLNDIEDQISEEKLAQLTSDDGNIVDETVVSKAIADADSTIDSYISKAYSVPVMITPVPPKLNQLSVTIAVYKLFSRRASNVGGVNEVVRTDYEDAIRFLELVAVGKATIGIAPTPQVATSTGGMVSGGKRTFSGSSMRKL